MVGSGEEIGRRSSIFPYFSLFDEYLRQWYSELNIESS